MSEPWAAPDAPAEDAPARIVPVPGSGASAGSATSGAAWTGGLAPGSPPEVPVPLRPLDVGDRIDGGLRILKLAPGPVVALAAVAVVPIQLIGLVGLRSTNGVSDGNDQLEATIGRPLVAAVLAESGTEVVLAVTLLLLEALAVAFVAGGLGILVSGWYRTGEPRSATALLGAAARRVPAVAVAWLLVHALEVAFAAGFAIGGLVPMTWFALTAPVIGAEGAGPVEAMRRSYRLVRGSFMTVAGTCLLVALVDTGLRFSLSALGFVYLDLDLPGGWAVATAAGIGARLVSVPFVAGAAVLLYLDRRVRVEGLDIELAADERFPHAS